jgi:DNA-binding NarL/FixJ family response regulator
MMADPVHSAVVLFSSSPAAAGGGSIMKRFTSQALAEQATFVPGPESGSGPLKNIHHVASEVARPGADPEAFRGPGRSNAAHQIDPALYERIEELAKIEADTDHRAIPEGKVRARRFTILDFKSIDDPANKHEDFRTYFYRENDPHLGFVLFAEFGELAWLELDPGQFGAVYAPGHANCHSVAFTAQRDGRTVIGNAHLYVSEPGYSPDALLQYEWVLKQLSDKTNGFSDVQIALSIDGRWEGFPLEIKIEDLEERALLLRIHPIQSVVSGEGALLNVMRDVLTTPSGTTMVFKRHDGIILPGIGSRRFWNQPTEKGHTPGANPANQTGQVLPEGSAPAPTAPGNLREKIVASLSARQRRVLGRVGMGWSDKEIAGEEPIISVSTVKAEIGAIRRKLGMADPASTEGREISRFRLIQMAHRLGAVPNLKTEAPGLLDGIEECASSTFSPEQKEIFELMKEDLTMAEIEKRTGIAMHMVKYYIRGMKAALKHHDKVKENSGQYHITPRVAAALLAYYGPKRNADQGHTPISSRPGSDPGASHLPRLKGAA